MAVSNPSGFKGLLETIVVTLMFSLITEAVASYKYFQILKLPFEALDPIHSFMYCIA